jgi:hypothetical protein
VLDKSPIIFLRKRKRRRASERMAGRLGFRVADATLPSSHSEASPLWGRGPDAWPSPESELAPHVRAKCDEVEAVLPNRAVRDASPIGVQPRQSTIHGE